ncbi:MAG: ribulokinase, partial [Defluviitaleaceae bacterium]|nr:ribulokinase [Defluviitaleaceae bacterium]
MGKKYAIGVDFGTLSGRSVLVEVEGGREVATSVSEYRHKVMDERLPDGARLGHDWALQHPQDYLDVFSETIPAVLKAGGVDARDVIGVGIDFTACTVLPTDSSGEPLCFMDEYKSNPRAYVKLWKHHAAQDEANRLNEIAGARGESFLKRYGGKISSEWAVPKVWQILNEAPEIYEACGR